MALTLEVIHHKGIPSVNPLRARFGQGGGTVGRSLDNNLPLPDEDKIISRYHGKICYQNGEFVYIDTSVGGTLLCNKNRFLEKEDSVVLVDGDHLKIGEYELVVRIEPEEQPFPGLFPDLGAQQPFSDINRAESGLGVNVQPLFGDSEFTPVLGQNMPPLRPALQNDSFINQPDVSPFQQSFTPPDIQKLPEDFSFDGVLQENYSSDQSVSANKDDFAFPDDWFGNLGTDAGMQDSKPDQAPSPFLSAPQIPPTESFVAEHQPSAALGDGNANLFDGDGLEPSSFSLNWAVGDGSSPFDAPQGEIDKTISVGGKSSAVNVQNPPPFPGNASILAAIPADGTHALPGGSERLGDFQESLPPFAKGGQGGLKAETSMTEGSQSPLNPLLQRGELVE